MNTIEIRKNHKELIDNLNESIKRYEIWFRQDYTDACNMHRAFVEISGYTSNYRSFLERCVQQDIESLIEEINKYD
jgi:putative salt-induced outer membrane protein YdiY